MTAIRCLVLAAAGAVTAAAVDLPAIDLVGGAAFTDVNVGLGISVGEAHARDADKDFTVLRLGASAYSVSGYPLASNPKVGGLLGGAVLARLWTAHDNDVTWTAFDPAAILVAGGFYRPSEPLRIDLTGEAGPSLDFARFDDGDASRSAWFRPGFHAGVHLAVMAQVDQRSAVGAVFGYDYDWMPYVTAEGPFVALVITWNAGKAKK